MNLNNSFNASGGAQQSSTTRSKLFGDVTLEIIDDFLNPINKKKTDSQIHKIKFIPTSESFGLGLRTYDSDDEIFNDADSDRYSRPKTPVDDFKYAEQLRADYEKELVREMSFADQSASIMTESVYQDDGTNSMVGSQMSQIESVSTMYMSKEKKKSLMKRVEKFADMNIYEEDGTESLAASDINNNLDMSRKMNVLANVYNGDDEIDKNLDFSKEEKRLQLYIEFCKNYKFTDQYDPKLPITKMRSHILNCISSYKFCVIQGGTGTGKTTQVPQYILDSHVKEKKYCNIIVTQPRRIAATSIARRVCNERSWDLGRQCGYQIGLDRSKVCEDTRITYVTTGILLQKLIGEGAEENFNKIYTHIILDEVHERDLDTDFILLLIKMKSLHKLNAKIIIMSATLKTELFIDYFTKTKSNEREQNPQPINIDSQTYEVKEQYWDDLISDDEIFSIEPTKSFRNRLINQNSKLLGSKYLAGNCYTRKEYVHFDNENQIIRELKSRIVKKKFDFDNPEMSEEQIIMTINLLKKFDHIDIDEINQRYKDYLEKEKINGKQITRADFEKPTPDRSGGYRIINGLAEKRGAVLIFVPGMLQIQKLQEAISHEFENSKNLVIYPLHSDIVIEQQNRVFEKAGDFHRKIIISTGIAESSITVPDIKYVIDFCLTKELYCDPNTNYSHLRLEWASKASMKQRKGRAGRVSDGRCYRLISKEFFKDLNEQTDPAILREPLEKVILNLKRLEQSGEPRQILSLAIQPPKLSGIEKTILLLKQVGALTLKCKNSKRINPHDGDLTYAGRIMANLPIDVRLSKLILLGHTFGKLNEAIIIAAGLSKKTVFTCYYKSYLESFNSKWIYSQGWMCDCLCILNAFKVYEDYKKKGEFDEKIKERNWARENNIELGRMKELYILQEELKKRLENLNIRSTEGIKLRDDLSPCLEADEYDIDDEDDVESKNLIIKIILAGAFYPHYFVSNKVDIEEADKMTGGYGYLNTVQIKNLPMDQGVLYSRNIEKIFSPCANLITTHFDGAKAYLEFKSKHDVIDSNVNIGVYRAVQMRLLRLATNLKRYTASVAADKLKCLKDLNLSRSESLMKVSIDSAKGAFKIVLDTKNNNNRNSSSSTLNNDNENSFHNENDSDDEYRSSDDEFVHPKSNSSFRNSEQNFRPNKYSSALSLYRDNYNNENQKSSRNISDSGRGMSSSSLQNLSSSRYTPSNDENKPTYLSDPRYILPKQANEEQIKICITEVVTCANFYAQISDDQHESVLKNIITELNSSQYPKNILKLHDLKTDTLCYAYYYCPYDTAGDISGHYRARILHYDRKSNQVEIQYIDFGNRDKKRPDELFELTEDMLTYPFQAIECKLANIKPNIIKNPNGVWANRINKKFREKTLNNLDYNYEIKIENIESNIVFVVLHGIGVTLDKKINFNEYLVKEGYAEKVTSNRSEFKPNFSLSGETLYIPVRQADVASKMPMHVPHNQSFSTLPNKNSNYSRQSRSRLFDNIDYDNNSTICETIIEDDEDDKLFFGEIEIKGPYSPLEVSYFSLINSGTNKKIRTERESINYACIDDDPQSDFGRLMIGVDISLSANRESILLRKTTLMPKIRGIASICCMMFCPMMELRVDPERSRYTGALCGLGFDNDSGSINPENDIEIAFDVEIDLSDVTMINGLRMAINLVIGSEDDVKSWTTNERNLRKLQQKACSKLLKVINRVRVPAEPKYTRKQYKWNQIHPNELIQAMDNSGIQDTFPSSASSVMHYDDLFFSYHKCIALNSRDDIFM